MLGVAEDEKEIKSVENIIAKNAEEYVSFDLRFRFVNWHQAGGMSMAIGRF